MMRRGNSVYMAKVYEKDEVRRGDWICLVCNNHNFSFRKFCNRCENQSRRDNELQTNILRKRIDIQINLELEASYNTFPRALFLTLRQESSRLDSKFDPKAPVKAPSLTFIEDGEPSPQNDHCRWVRLMIDEQVCSPEETNKENIFYCSNASAGSDKTAYRALSVLTQTVSY